MARQRIILEAIERQKKLTPELRGEDSRDLRPRRARGPLPPLRRRRRAAAARAREAGPRAPRRLDLELRPRHRDAPSPARPSTCGPSPSATRRRASRTPRPRSTGAADILVERLAEMAELRARVRAPTSRRGCSAPRRPTRPSPTASTRPTSRFQEKVVRAPRAGELAPLPRGAAGRGRGRAAAFGRAVPRATPSSRRGSWRPSRPVLDGARLAGGGGPAPRGPQRAQGPRLPSRSRTRCTAS